MKKHSNLGDEIFTIKEPKDRSNLYIGITFGVVFTICAVVYAFMSQFNGLV